MPERHPDILEVLIGEMAEHRHIDLVLAKALRVLGHAELFEPVRNLLHCAASLRGTCGFSAKISDQHSDVNSSGEAQGTSALRVQGVGDAAARRL
jgi:hypothetical protein